MKNQWIKFSLLFIIFLTGCSTDLYTKQLAVKKLKDAAYVTVVDGFVEFAYTENRGMVFGIMSEHKSDIKHYVLTTTTIIAIGFMIFIVWRMRNMSFIYLFPFFLILSGAFGNLIDRLRFGRVVDFIHIFWHNALDWPFLFNLADAWICIGGVLLAILMLFKKDIMEQTIFQQHAQSLSQ